MKTTKAGPRMYSAGLHKYTVLWDVALCSTVDKHDRFMGTSCLLRHGEKGSRERKRYFRYMEDSMETQCSEKLVGNSDY